MPTPEINAPSFVEKQYKDATNLKARLNLHQRFSTNKYGWHRFVFDQFKLPPICKILELGCGSGTLWQENLDRIPTGWEITLTDLSAGMLGEARLALQDHRLFNFETVDAQSIPFESGSFDAVIANHMLYHLPDRRAAFSEIHRVLSPGGWFFAATNSSRHLIEIPELLKKFEPSWSWQRQIGPFLLENAEEQLDPWFESIHLYRYEDASLVNEAAPLVDYIYSMRQKPGVEQRSRFAEFVSAEIASQGGVFRITKEAGLFVSNRKGD